jgi:hypothetical protein
MNQLRAKIKSWQQFARHVRRDGCKLLAKLDDFPDAVLVAGCQRSGTTILARTITASAGMVDYRFGKDDELDAALILSGRVKHDTKGRYCFQTTYLNECYPEYFEHAERQRIIWVIRNPYSVIYSLVYHWKRFAFNELFDSCGVSQMTGNDGIRFEHFGRFGIGRIRRACYSYNGKTRQLFEIYRRLGSERVLVVDYDDIVQRKDDWLPKIYRFIQHPYHRAYSDGIHQRSVKKAERLSAKERKTIEQLCLPVYQEARALLPCDN